MNLKELAELLPFVDKGIRPLVEALNRRGVITVSSCEGHLSPPIPCVDVLYIDIPYIDVDFEFNNPSFKEKESMERLLFFVGKWNIEKGAKEGKKWIITPLNFRESVCTLRLRPELKKFRDSRDLQVQVFELFQKEAKELAEFILHSEDPQRQITPLL